jgi:hypothetical protein
MSPSDPARPGRGLRLALFVLVALVALVLALPSLLAPVLGGRIHAEARARGLDASWDHLTFAWPLRLELRGLSVSRPGGPALALRAARLEASLWPRGLSLRPRIARLVLDHATVALPAGGADDDTTIAREDESAGSAGPAAPRVRAVAEQVVETLLLPARRLPELSITDLDVERGDSLLARLDALSV